jgi:3-methylfumaryl-CoA hydratase
VAEPASRSAESWRGRTEEVEDVATLRMAAHMAVTLGRDDPPPRSGDLLPLGWHWVLCPWPLRVGETGPDGLPTRGGFMPDIALPRRMWAGGRMTVHGPLHLGETVRRVSEIVNFAEKEGRSGPIAFVTTRHRYFGPAGLAVEEEQDTAFRAEKRPGEQPPPPAPPPAEPTWRRTVEPDPVMLFRYSALTFNCHRIHYDAPYATGVEGYPGLLVHGPLIATLLFDLIRRNAEKPVASLSYRAMRPLYVNVPFEVEGAPTEDGQGCVVWALDPEGAVAMQVQAAYGG